MKKITRTYKFATPRAYFEAEQHAQTQAGSPHSESDRDTHQAMGKRLGVAENTITRIVNERVDPSWALGLAISKDADIDPHGIGRSAANGRKKARK